MLVEGHGNVTDNVPIKTGTSASQEHWEGVYYLMAWMQEGMEDASRRHEWK